MEEQFTKKLVAMEEEIKEYLDKSIIDIARKCGVYVEDVIETIKKIIVK